MYTARNIQLETEDDCQQCGGNLDILDMLTIVVDIAAYYYSAELYCIHIDHHIIIILVVLRISHSSGSNNSRYPTQ